MNRSHFFLASTLALSLACGGTVESTPDDGGSTEVSVHDASADGGLLEDTRPLDTGAASDTGAAFDTGAASDTGAAFDTGTAFDTGAAFDTGTAFDSGFVDSGEDTGSAGCNDLVASGAAVTATRVPSAPPSSLAGGAVVEGTYVLTKMVEYTGVGGSGGVGYSQSGMLELSSGSYRGMSMAGSTIKRAKGTYAVSGSTFTLAESCPSSTAQVFDYEVKGTDVVWLAKTAGTGFELTWTKL